jgi:hypothetical protein
MLICTKYSHDGKDIQTIHFNDATSLVSVSSDNLFWTQKTTDSKYKLGDVAANVDKKIPNEPICVYNSESVCHHRLMKFFLEAFLREKITAELKSKSSQ